MKNNIALQQGQALVESLVLLLILISFFIAIPYLGRLIDISITQSNASRYGAFQLTRQLTGLNESYIKEKFFLKNDQQWRDRQNQKIVHEGNILLHVSRLEKLSNGMQPGKKKAQVLREEWGIEDKGIARVDVSVSPSYTQGKSRTSTALGLGLVFFDGINPFIKRHTSILTDAGHSDSDLSTHKRTARTNTAWGKAAKGSYELGRSIQSYAAPVDRGFSRPQPVFDWLEPWAGKIPQRHLRGK